MNTATTVLLLDTLSLLFRAHHALPPMSTRSGEPTSALYGLSVLLTKLLREQRPLAGIAFALDAPVPTFRHRERVDYKAGRPRPPSDLVRQLQRLPELVAALGAVSIVKPGFEADDVLASLARAIGEDPQLGPLVVSGDRDLLQVARGGARVLFVGRRGKDHVLYDEALVEARFGVPVRALPSYVALVGDPSDNLPKVPGVGAKTAARLVREHGDIAGIYAHLAEVHPDGLRAALAERREQVRQSEGLARLRDDLELGEPLFAPLGPASFDGLARWFEALEFKSLLARLDALR